MASPLQAFVGLRHELQGSCLTLHIAVVTFAKVSVDDGD